MKSEWYPEIIIIVMISMCIMGISLSSSSPSNDGGLQEKNPQASIFYHVDMIVTAYCKESCCCGKWADGITASGVPAEGKLIAAPHPEYPFGTIMDIPGYGEATVQDRGGAIKGNKIDVLMDSHEIALQWGVQRLKVKVYFLN